MQTNEYRHLSKREKRNAGRTTKGQLKRAMAYLAALVGDCKTNEAARKETLLEERREWIAQLRGIKPMNEAM